MKRFAANYLLAESGILLKNGILEANDSGIVLRILDTKGDLRESERLTFQSGILIPGFKLVKTGLTASEIQFSKMFPDDGPVSLQNLIDAGKVFQVQFPEKNIRQFFSEMNKILVQPGIYHRQILPGVFLLTGSDLVNMKFTAKSRLKKLL